MFETRRKIMLILIKTRCQSLKGENNCSLNEASKYVWMTTSVVRHDMIMILGSGNTFNYTEDNRLTN